MALLDLQQKTCPRLLIYHRPRQRRPVPLAKTKIAHFGGQSVVASSGQLRDERGLRQKQVIRSIATKDIFAASRKDILARHVPANSRVSLLVEKIQESLSKQSRAADEPSSSSPLPGKHSQMLPSQASPTKSPSKARQTSQKRTST